MWCRKMFRIVNFGDFHSGMTYPGEVFNDIICNLIVAEYPGCVFLYKDVSDHGTFNTEIEDGSQKVTMCQ